MNTYHDLKAEWIDTESADLLDALTSCPWSAGKKKPVEDLHADHSIAQLYAMMPKDGLVALAQHYFRRNGRLSPDKAKEKYGFTLTQLRTMKKDDLAQALTAIYLRELPEVLRRLSVLTMARLIEQAEENAPRIFLAGAQAGDAAPLSLLDVYDETALSDLLVCLRLTQAADCRAYGLVMPAELRSFLHERHDTLLTEAILNDQVQQYAAASVNLYGIVKLDELSTLIRQYEAKVLQGENADNGGSNLDHLVAGAKAQGDADLVDLRKQRELCARTLCSMSLEKLLSYLRPEAKMGDYIRLSLPIAHVDTTVLFIPELILNNEDDWYEAVQSLMEERKRKHRYAPDTYAAFMGYAEGPVNADVPAAADVAALAQWLEKKHRSDILRSLEYESIRRHPLFGLPADLPAQEAVAQAAQVIAEDVYLRIVCATLAQFEDASVHDLLEVFGVHMRGMKEVDEYLALWNSINSGSRMFGNYGHTPQELMDARAASGPATLSFGPGLQGTDIPAAIQRAIANGEFGDQLTVSPDEVARASRKVGRNEPCPCGSGKKYKNCCGK